MAATLARLKKLEKKVQALEPYTNSTTPIKFRCNKNHQFVACPRHIKLKRYCPICFCSKGEQQISDILTSLGVEHIREWTPEGCKRRYDFYLPQHNFIIEFDHKQHFEHVRKFGGKRRFRTNQLVDVLKTQYAVNELQLSIGRIDYTHKEVEQLINEWLEVLEPEAQALYSNDKLYDYIINNKTSLSKVSM